uniref:Uncharacterized protein n=1 Tax=Tanacetum cinerariifolium TaxID=118510 RepID=A0A699KZX6_TANCI|nr:hypothetical protein [Tanacetum cinerariifolium]
MKPKRKDTEVPQLSVSTSVVDEAINEEMDDSLERVATTTTSLYVEQDRGNIFKTQSNATPNKPGSQGTSSGGGPRCQESIGDVVVQTRFERVSKVSNDPLLTEVNTSRSARVKSSKDEGFDEEDASKQRKISDIDADDDITLVSTHDEQLFDADKDLHGKEVFVAQQDKNVVEKEVDVAQVQVTIATTTTTISIDEATLSQTLTELKYAKPKTKAKGIVFHKAEDSTTTTMTATPKTKSQVNDKGKTKMIEELMKLKKKDQN